MEYALIDVLTSESAHYHQTPVYQAIIQCIRSRRIAARTHVYRGIAGAYEGGEFATTALLDLSEHLPVKIEILMPAAELEQILPLLGELVTDGVVLTRPVTVHHHVSQGRLLPRDLRVADVMTGKPVAVKADAPVWKVVRILMSATFRSLPVVDDAGRVVGIVSDDDLVSRARLPVRPGVLMRLGMNPGDSDPEFAHLAGMKVSDIQTAPVDTILGTAFLQAAIDKMVRKSRRVLPVIDATGRLVGMCSRRDVLQAAGHWERTLERWKDTSMSLNRAETVSDLMSGAERCAAREATLMTLGQLMMKSGSRRVAVVDPQQHLVGIVAEQDLLQALEPHKVGVWASLVRRLGKGQAQAPELSARAAQLTAAAIMTGGPVSVGDGESLGTAARLMAEHGLKELPVVDGEARFVGFLSRRDLMRAIATWQPVHE